MTAVWAKEDPIPAGRELAISIGKFDGVHRGHRQLLGVLRDRARKNGLESMAIALDPHPLAVLAPDSAPQKINSVADRGELLTRLGLDHVKLEDFNRELANLSAEQFLGQLAAAGMRMLVAGANTRIGRRRTAGIPEMKAICARLQVTLRTVPIASEGEAFSTANLRARIGSGDLSGAAAITGRRHSLVARVKSGDGRGAELGFPTANLSPDPQLQLPPDGVYAVSALLAGEKGLRTGVANFGVRPTFGGECRLLEVHLFDFNGRLEGQPMRIYFERFLRPEKKFAGPAELVRQIEVDCRAARAVSPGEPRRYAPWLRSIP
jgi:riboflavin kinase/FMN adenylyltransferase